MQTILVHPKSIYKFRYDDHAQVVNQFTTIVEKNHQDYLPNAVISNDQIDITCIMRPETFSGKILDWLSFLKTSFSQILDHENLVHKGFEVELMWLVYQKELNTTGSEPHSHANSVFSGIYYVDVSENCFTEFLEDDHIFRRSNHVLRKNGSVYGPQVETINFSSGDLIFFRSDMVHKAVHSHEKRIIIAFNINLKGLGSLNELTYKK